MKVFLLKRISANMKPNLIFQMNGTNDFGIYSAHDDVCTKLIKLFGISWATGLKPVPLLIRKISNFVNYRYKLINGWNFGKYRLKHRIFNRKFRLIFKWSNEKNYHPT